MGHRRPQVGVELKALPQAQNRRLGPQLQRQVVPLVAADGAEQDRIAALHKRHRFRGQRVAGPIVGGAADQPICQFRIGRHEPQHLDRLGHHLRPDAVAGQNRYLHRAAAPFR
jgi:hypothetical protein